MGLIAASEAFPPVDQHYLLQARQMQALSFAVHIPLVAFGISFPAIGHVVPELFVSAWALPELIEAAVRCRDGEPANNGFARLSEVTDSTGTDWSLGTEARCHALLSHGEQAEELYHEAIERLGRPRLRPRARVCPSRLPRMAPSREPPGGRARAAPHRLRAVRRDRYGSVRRNARATSSTRPAALCASELSRPATT